MTGNFEVLDMEKKAELDALRELRKQVDASKGLDCPSCANVGWYPNQTDHDEWEQIQCEFCCTVPDSIYSRAAAKMKEVLDG